MPNFDAVFKALTGNPPFPWQQALYERFIADRPDNIPASCNLPTGLGKTSVIAVWLIALANGAKVPRRLVYVVNRRTVVDQTTDEVEKYRSLLGGVGPVWPEELRALAERLAALSSDPAGGPLAVSTLRGQFADNREWSADPSRPAVICGTVDMIGSRLLFSGYGVGMRGKPLHAGFLGQDTLLVHDEAHLEPAFQELLLAIEKEQKRCKDFNPLRVMELTATSRGSGTPFGLTDADRTNTVVKERVGAPKKLHLEAAKDAKKLAEQLTAKALEFAERNRAVVVFTRTVDDVMKVAGKLPKDRVVTLTGTMRGKERDALVEDPIFKRFMPGGQSDEPSVFLVCTSAGEVGVNISGDHLICDLSTFDSMAQRFGRVNRFGKRPDTEVHVVHPTAFEDDDYDQRRMKTLSLLRELNGDGSPDALGKLSPDARQAAFAPTPVILPATDILFDAWALTTITDQLPGRPPVEPYLHGITDDQFDTEFAWREEVSELTGKVDDKAIAELLDEFPLKPHETLKVPTFHKKNGAYLHLEAIRDRDPDQPAWVIDPNGGVTVYATLTDLLKKQGKDEYAVRLAERSVILPPKAGGLTTNGTLDGSHDFSTDRLYDVAGNPPAKVTPLLRLLVTPGDEGDTIKPVGRVRDWPDDTKIAWKGRTYRIDGQPPLRVIYALDIPNPENEEAPAKRYVVVKPIAARTGETPTAEWPALDAHLRGVAGYAEQIASRLKLDAKLAEAVELAAAWHDHGKSRPVWQRGAGNTGKYGLVAKTLHGRPPENLNHYRHELGSMVDVSTRADLAAKFDALDDDHKDVVLHLIATHHGRGRPHFPSNESHDLDRPNGVSNAIATDTPGRFARLQRRFGRWGLAYLESLLRAADVLESQRIEHAPIPESKEWPPAEPITPPTPRPLASKPMPTASITVSVDSTNPGQFFACCGLLELADRLWPGAEGWFSESGREFRIDRGTLTQLLDSVVDCHLTNTMTAAQHARFKEITAMRVSERKSTPGVEAEEKLLGALLRESPIVLSGPFAITLDWFADDHAGGSRFKTWAGRQSVLDISNAMKEALAVAAWRTEQCLSYSVSRCGLPFNFDSDLGGQGGAIDIGFSFDPLAGSALTRIEPTARPALELLAFVGLQRFRPAEMKGENRFVYSAWDRPLPIQVAAPAACGALPVGKSRFEFRLLYRTKYLKSFLPAVPVTGGSDE